MVSRLPMQINKNWIKEGNWGLHAPPRDDFQKHEYLCIAKRGLCFSWSHCLCLHCFSRLKLNYADTHTNIRRIFILLELHTHASDFSGYVKLQTLAPYLILIYTFLWLCAENCTLVTTNARFTRAPDSEFLFIETGTLKFLWLMTDWLSTFWQLTKCTNNAFWLIVELSSAILLYNRVGTCIGRWEEDEDAKSCA